jgi:hypothetical protein
MRIGDGQLPRAREMLENCPVKQRCWEWGRLMRRISPELLTIRTAEFDDRPEGSLHNAIFSPDEQYILDDRPGFQWFSVIDLHTGKTIMKSKQYPGGGWRECSHFMPDKDYVSYSSGPNTVDIIDFRTDEMRIRFGSGKGALRSFVVSPNGKLAAGYSIVKETGEREIILWDTSTARELSRFRMEILDPSVIPQFKSEKGWWSEKLSIPSGLSLIN